MHVELVREYRFEAAHRLPRVPEGHRCARLHGHNWVVEVRVAGEVDERTGFLIDYADIDAAARPVVAALDHRCLNDVDGLENPTSEVLARWLWQRLAPALPGLAVVTVAETPGARCVYRGR